MSQVSSPGNAVHRPKKNQPPDNALRRLLRGRHNSIRYRFITRPREWLEYALFRITGGTWIDYYTKRLDRAAARSKEDLGRQEYVVQGEEHFAIIKANGLKPNDRFLDYGCGILRVGIHVIRYLEPKHYTGVEISKDRLARGREMAAQHGVADDQYQTLIVHDCHLKELGDQQFDFIWAWSVVNHMPNRDVQDMLAVENDADRYVCSRFKSQSGSPLACGLIRPLGVAWAAIVFGREWMMETAKSFGSPFIDATVDSKMWGNDAELAKFQQFLTDAAANRWMIRPEGTTVTITPAQSLGGSMRNRRTRAVPRKSMSIGRQPVAQRHSRAQRAQAAVRTRR